jgi:hypothetical protein
MSLAERVSALEDWDFSRDASPAAQERRRKLSYNPLPAAWVNPEDNKPNVPAFEVSQTKRLGMFYDGARFSNCRTNCNEP